MKFCLTIILIFITTVNSEEASTLYKKITDSLPKKWTVQIDGTKGLRITVKTDVIPTVPSVTRGGSTVAATLHESVNIYIYVLPRLTEDMIKILKKQNKEIEEKMNKLDPRSGKYALLNFKLAKIPEFSDNRYGFLIYGGARVPKLDKDKKAIKDFLLKISKNWKLYNKFVEKEKELLDKTIK